MENKKGKITTTYCYNNHILLFHIGIAKTGTTSLQNFLQNNQEGLNRQGWHYPAFREADNIHDYINGFKFFESILRKNDSNIESHMNIILDCLKKYNVIVSCEGFWQLDNIDEELFAKVLKFYDNIKIVVYLRRQDQYIESLYNQHVKNGICEDRELSEFVEAMERNNLVGYLNKLKKMENLVGKENLIVRRFERNYLKNGDAVADFLSLIGIDLDKDDWHFDNDVESQNMSLGSQLLEIERAINKVVAPYSLFHDTIVNLNNENVKNGKKDSSKTMPPEMRKQILQQHEKENEEIAKRYFGEEQLFKDMNTEINYSKFRLSPVEEDIIKIFADILNKQEINLAFLNTLHNK